MSEKSNVSVTGGVGFCGLLIIVFVVFKLLGKLDWSWWWVFSPIWIPVLIMLGILIIIAVVTLILFLLKKRRGKI